ncbi:metallophosphoesterase [Kamptonema cortianum]|nr:metallophosphoesterase [Geitlerinema splendidum]MDK3157024.1 metallophosphoesterase [Kamptonema cortianum]
MRWIWPALAVGAGALVYGALFETERLKPVRRKLLLPDWPEHLNGFKLGLMADMHVRDRETISLTKAALKWLADEEPDIVAYVGDYVNFWEEGRLEQLEFAMEEADAFAGKSVAVPGNHDYFTPWPPEFEALLKRKGVKLLRNEVTTLAGIQWVGIDSANAGMADPFTPILECDPCEPMVVLWHEPDMVDYLPRGAQLMLAGHSHGGQFLTPWGWAPKKTVNGRKYVRGFYRHAPTPLYVSAGLATTGPPARLFCPPEVTLLTLYRGSNS